MCHIKSNNKIKVFSTFCCDWTNRYSIALPVRGPQKKEQGPRPPRPLSCTENWTRSGGHQTPSPVRKNDVKILYPEIFKGTE